MRAVVSEKGQVTIPQRLRSNLGIRPGQALDFDEEDGRLVARKVSDRDPIDDLYGLLSLEDHVDAFVSDLRGDSSD